MHGSVKKVVLAYSGGLDTSVVVPWLRETYDCSVVTFTAYLGQDEELKGLREKAINSGAEKAYIEDLREELVNEYIFPVLKAGAVYENRYLLGTSLARPLTAKRQIEIAEEEKADAVAHGCTGKGNDQVRFELTYRALNPDIRVIAPWREWNIKSRKDALDYARKKKIPVSSSAEKSYSHDSNIWHRSTEGNELEDPWNEFRKSSFSITRDPERAPSTPRVINIEFEQGVPVALNGKYHSPVRLIEKLNEIAGEHGIGRVDMVENRLVGMKSRGIYETPAGTVLFIAHGELESLVLDRETMHFKQMISQKYAQLVYNGMWFTPLREALDSFINYTQRPVNGEVKLKLYRGNVMVLGRRSPDSLFKTEFATFENDDVYDHGHAEGFINLYGLPLKIRALKQEEQKNRQKNQQHVRVRSSE